MMSNIAAGFARPSARDFAHFLALAKGSVLKVPSLLHLADDRSVAALYFHSHVCHAAHRFVTWEARIGKTHGMFAPPSRPFQVAISVVYRGCAIPVAWVILPAGTKRAWRREWLRLLRRLHRAIPRTWQVIVLADRGLYAPWLFRRITRPVWHPFLRINTGGSFRPTNATCWCPFLDLVPRPGTSWRGTGIAFTRKQVPCTLLARWEDGYKDPWLILTDLAPEASDAGWYGLRAWIEQGFKITKRAGWQWHRTRMRDPDRAARLWLAVVVATLWLLSVGEVANATIPASTLLDVTGMCPERPRTRRATRLRLVSVFRQGWVTLLVAFLRQDPLPQGRFVPEPWPVIPPLEEVHEPAIALLQAA